MRLGYFTMPVHPQHRSMTQTLKEDREAVILADKLGFYDAFIGEHLTDQCENITNSMLFLATLISDTSTIKLATGTTNLSQMHPVLVAGNAAMFDHLSEGRFVFGISPGNLPSDAEVLGIMDEDRNKMFADSIEIILEIWNREPPYEIHIPGNRFDVSTEKTYKPHIGIGIMPKPYQTPRPEIVGTVVAPYSKGVIAMGERDFHPLSANFLLSKWVKTHWGNYEQGKANVGIKADPADWRVARTIFVCEDEDVARRYGGEDANSPYRHYCSQLHAKFTLSGKQILFKESREEPDEIVTPDYMLDKLVVAGGVNKVVDSILALREEIGPFGELVYAGMDWVDPVLARSSMRLMAEEVMPKVNAAIGE